MGDTFREAGFDVVSLDIDPRTGADYHMDVLKWKYWETFERGEFDVVFCCPLCTEYSQALTTRTRDLKKADAIVRRAINVIKYLNPRMWLIENPRNGLLKSRRFMQGYGFVDLDYCQCASWGYKKPTRIWGGDYIREVRPVLCPGRSCQNALHKVRALGARRAPGWEPHENVDSRQRANTGDPYRPPVRLETGPRTGNQCGTRLKGTTIDGAKTRPG